MRSHGRAGPLFSRPSCSFDAHWCVSLGDAHFARAWPSRRLAVLKVFSDGPKHEVFERVNSEGRARTDRRPSMDRWNLYDDRQRDRSRTVEVPSPGPGEVVATWTVNRVEDPSREKNILRGSLLRRGVERCCGHNSHNTMVWNGHGKRGACVGLDWMERRGANTCNPMVLITREVEFHMPRNTA